MSQCTVYAVTGANGQIGRYLVSYLRQRGNIVFELVRSINKAADEKYYRFFDLCEPNNIPSLKDIDVLIHPAYFFDLSDVEKYKVVNIDGTMALFEKAKNGGVKYAIFISTISAYEDAKSLYGKTKFQLEQRLRLYDNVAIIRPGLIFHHPLQGMAESLDRYIRKLRIVPVVGSGKQLIYPCLLDDLVKFIVTLSQKKPIVRDVLVAASFAPITLMALIEYLSKRAKKNIFTLKIPFVFIFLVLKTLEKLRIPLVLHSDNLLGLQYTNPGIDFSGAKKLGGEFNNLS